MPRKPRLAKLALSQTHVRVAIYTRRSTDEENQPFTIVLSVTQDPRELGGEELLTVPMWGHDVGDDACGVGGGTFSMNQRQAPDPVT